MYVRVVRFTDVSNERMQGLRERVDSGGPPEEARVSKVQILHDSANATAVVLQHFDSAEDMEQGGAVFAAMDPADTPGTRASVDTCELLLELSPR